MPAAVEAVLVGVVILAGLRRAPVQVAALRVALRTPVTPMGLGLLAIAGPAPPPDRAPCGLSSTPNSSPLSLSAYSPGAGVQSS